MAKKKKKHQKKTRIIHCPRDASLTADGFDGAFIGWFERCAHPRVAVYDYETCVRILMDRDGMSREDAIAYMGFNVVGGWVGEGTPAFMHRSTKKEFDEICSE
jgi:hypothetical protein